MTPSEFELYLVAAKKYGVTRLRTKEFEVEFNHLPDWPPRNVTIGDEEKAPTEDQLLFWSSGLAPESEAAPPNEA